MKKQILFLTMFTLALIFAGTNKVFGQLLPGITTTTPIDPLSCIAASEPLHPFPGVPYKYVLDGDNGVEVASSYTWWTTKDVNFIIGEVVVPAMTNTNMAGRLTVTPGQLIATSTNYATTTPASTVGADTLTITWSSDILAGTTYQGDGVAPNGTPTFVVGYAEGDNCADNIQVFEIAPVPNFTIDITAIDPTDNATKLGWGIDTAKTCVDVIQSAVYTAGEVIMDYGENTIYYEVAAANFVKNWTPRFQILGGLLTTQEAVISIYSTLADATGTGTALFTSGTLAVADMNTDILTATALTANVPADVATGVSVYVKVVITNNNEESLVNNPFILAVDAIDNDAAGIWDMEDDDCSGGGGLDEADQVDKATITVTPRPQLDDATTPELIPNPDTYIPKN